MSLDLPIISAFACELLFALGIIYFIITRSSIPKCLKKKKQICAKVCDEPTCKKIEECMIKYMKKQLAHDDNDTEEFEDVKKQLKAQISIHNQSEVPREEERQAMMQCLRTTLVKYPDDIRGRRRANVARQILAYHVYEDTDFFFTMETRIKRIANSVWNSLGSFLLFCLPHWLLLDNAKQRVLCFLDSLVIVLSSLKSLLVSLLDVYSDLCIVYAVLISLLRELNIQIEVQNFGWPPNPDF